jgi:hypothetical protein
MLNVLCLEDVIKDAELLNDMLLDAGYLVSMDIASGEKEYLDFLNCGNYDIIFSDNSLPGMNAFAALKLALILKPEIPFICVSGTIGEEKAVELLKQGASDYVLKDRLGRLALAVQRALQETEVQKKRMQAEVELKCKIDELVITNNELAFQIKEKEKREDELVILNNVLEHQISKRNQSESELIKAKNKAEESDKLKSAFLTNMSHEIRTPMNGILGFAELLREPNLSSDDQQDFIQTIQISTTRMLNTINSIVDISKIESGLIGIDIKETNLNEKIEFTFKFFKPEVEIKNLQFLVKKSLPAKESIIKTDNEKVYAVLSNLIKNAIKFTYDGSIEFGYEKKGEYLEFFVRDTGIGIPQNQLELIFERFRQGSESCNRGYEGSGLGLSISKSYVEMLGGRIWVESEEGKGSTFYFTLPYNAVSEKEIKLLDAVSGEHNEIQIKNLKILIVEDDEISYSLLSRTIQKISKEVLHALTGVEAVEACRNNPDLDLVFMDIRMPRMNGLEATQKIRQFNKDVIIIAQSAYAISGDSEKAIDAGCNEYISKPINKTLMFELIKKHFGFRIN